MTREEYTQYLRGPVWAEKRVARLKIDRFRCRDCGTAQNLEVHHLNYDRWGDEDVSRDLVTLCRRCHGALRLPPLVFAEPAPMPVHALSVDERALLAILSRSVDLADRFLRDELLPSVREELRPVIVSLGRSDWSAHPDVPELIRREAQEAIAEPWQFRGTPEEAYELTTRVLREALVKAKRNEAMVLMTEAENAGRFDDVESIFADLQQLERKWLRTKDSA